MTELPITEIRGIRIGQTENVKAGTGCTVLVCEDGMRAGVDIRGGGPASRETPLLNPLMAAQSIHAIVLGGGSAFGLGAANGVMKYLEEKQIGFDVGFDVGVTKVPLVVQSDIFDLTVGDPFTRPDAAMGYEAAKAAMEASNYRDGNYGVGCGATVGKIGGMETCMKTGIGSYAVQLGELQIGALVVVNALGDVFDWKSASQYVGVYERLSGGRGKQVRREHDPCRCDHERGLSEGTAVQDCRHGTGRLRPLDSPGPHLCRRRQHLCRLGRERRGGSGCGRDSGRRGGERSDPPRGGEGGKRLRLPLRGRTQTEIRRNRQDLRLSRGSCLRT